MYKLPKKRRDPLGIVVSSFGVGVVLAVAACWVATQRAAAAFGYHAALGRPFYRHLYPPFEVIAWALRFDHPERFGYGVHRVFVHAYGIIAVGSGLASLAVGALIVWQLRALWEHTDLYGSAHWATPKEVDATGLVGRDAGVYVGAWSDPRSGRTRYLRDGSTTHCLAFMPTGSGKTVGLVIPTLLAWEGSVVVHDLKGEIWAKTAGWRPPPNRQSPRFGPDQSRSGLSLHRGPCQSDRPPGPRVRYDPRRRRWKLPKNGQR